MPSDLPSDSETPARNASTSSSSSSPAAPRSLDSRELLQGACEVLIRHGDDTYRLRLTRNGKLILHK